MTRILFICHGNICRSAAAEMIMKQLLRERNMTGIQVDSAATSREEIGNDIYPPMKRVLTARGIRCEAHAARQLTARDGEEYDLIIGMDQENLIRMSRMLPSEAQGKVHLLMEYAGQPDQEIEDPWYSRRFDRVADQITEGCEGLLEQLRTIR